ncbi:hypothetical protein FQN54_008113 [Arachnomyces sp. PD_36]|nr:hypothetical protein FQN54_008113 [Arachnomyces sp. PD_36]
MASFSLPVSVFRQLRSLLKIFSRMIPHLKSWRTVAWIMILLNLKSLPFVWHLRMLYQVLAYIRLRPSDPYRCEPLLTPTGPSHPIFTPTSVTTHTTLLETDYNMHKSNSTYFTDLDVARTPLVTRLCSPGVGRISRQMETEYREQVKRAEAGPLPADEKKLSRPGPVAIVLGSVYCNFKREIRPFERYEVRSKLVAWDQKWMYILTYFIRPEKRPGSGKTLLAMGVSKYVIKKGRLTIRPERVLRASGLLPEKPEGIDERKNSTAGSDTGSDHSSSGDEEGAVEGVDGTLVREALTFSENGSRERERQLRENSNWDKHEWSWERLEEERVRGLGLMEGFIGLDTGLDREMEL